MPFKFSRSGRKFWVNQLQRHLEVVRTVLHKNSLGFFAGGKVAKYPCEHCMLCFQLEKMVSVNLSNVMWKNQQ